MRTDRAISPNEAALLESLLGMVPASEKYLETVRTLRIQELDDGGMGSFRIVNDQDQNSRRFGSQLVMAEFTDRDDVLVSVTLNLDPQGDLFEVDIWKTDNSPLQVWPSGSQLRRVDPK